MLKISLLQVFFLIIYAASLFALWELLLRKHFHETKDYLAKANAFFVFYALGFLLISFFSTGNAKDLSVRNFILFYFGFLLIFYLFLVWFFKKKMREKKE